MIAAESTPALLLQFVLKGDQWQTWRAVVQQLKVERDQVGRPVEQLDQAPQGLGGLSGLRPSGSRGRRFVTTQRTMSAAARRRIAAAQRARSLHRYLGLLTTQSRHGIHSHGA